MDRAKEAAVEIVSWARIQNTPGAVVFTQERCESILRRHFPSDDGELDEATQMLRRLEEYESNLMCHREKTLDGYEIWWTVIKRGRSISGHPLGSPQSAIRAARAALAKKGE